MGTTNNWQGAAISGGSGLLGSIFGGIFARRANRDTNRQNYRMFKEQQEYDTAERLATQEYNTAERLAAQAYNTSEREAAQDWNYNMWLAENEYNSPEAQRQRLVDAGYNPLMLGSGAFGSSGSVAPSPGASISPQSSSPQSVSAPDMLAESFNPDFATIAQMALAFSQVRKNEAETKGQEIKNSFDPKLYASELEMRSKSIENLSLQMKDLQNAIPWNAKKRERDYLLQGEYLKREQLNNELIEKTLQDRIDQCKWATKLSAKQWDSMEQQIQVAKKQIEKMDSDMLLNEAQKRHWINQDTIASNVSQAQIGSLREAMLQYRMNVITQAYGIPPSAREGVLVSLENIGAKGLKAAFSGSWYRDPNKYVQGIISGMQMAEEAAYQGMSDQQAKSKIGEYGRLGSVALQRANGNYKIALSLLESGLLDEVTSEELLNSNNP